MIGYYSLDKRDQDIYRILGGKNLLSRWVFLKKQEGYDFFQKLKMFLYSIFVGALSPEEAMSLRKARRLGPFYRRLKYVLFRMRAGIFRKMLYLYLALSAFFWLKIESVSVKWGVAGMTYFLAPHFALRPFMVSEPSAFDQLIPLMSWTVLVYLCLYGHVFVVMMVSSNGIILKNMLSMYIWVTIVLTAFYICVPISIPPVPFEMNTSLDYLMFFVRTVDVHMNALPSGHVTYSLLGPIFLIAIGEKGKMRRNLVLLLCGICISVSTLTTKQHHVFDVIVAAVLSMAFAIQCGWSARKDMIIHGDEHLLVQRKSLGSVLHFFQGWLARQKRKYDVSRKRKRRKKK